MRERINGLTINLAKATQQELRDLLSHAALRIQEATTDYEIIEDYLNTRFGTTQLALPNFDEYVDAPDWPDEEHEPSSDVYAQQEDAKVIELFKNRHAPSYPQDDGPWIA